VQEKRDNRLTHPGREELARVKVSSNVSVVVKVTKVSLQREASEQKAFLLSDGLVVMQKVVTQLQVVLQSRCLLPAITHCVTSTTQWSQGIIVEY